MIIRTVLGLFMVVMVCSCGQQPSQDEMPGEHDANQVLQQKSGLNIEYGPNLGALDKYEAGDYIFITSTITNDSIIPIHLHLAISAEFDYPDSCSDNRYKVFLLPKELTPDTASLQNSITDGLSDFLDECLDNPYVLDKTLKPGEYAVITIGTLLPRPTRCSVVALPRAVYVQGDDDSFQACDNRMPARQAGGHQDQSTNPLLTLGVKIDYYRGKSHPETCVVHLCGQVSYPEP